MFLGGGTPILHYVALNMPKKENSASQVGLHIQTQAESVAELQNVFLPLFKRNCPPQHLLQVSLPQQTNQNSGCTYSGITEASLSVPNLSLQSAQQILSANIWWANALIKNKNATVSLLDPATLWTTLDSPTMEVAVHSTSFPTFILFTRHKMSGFSQHCSSAPASQNRSKQEAHALTKDNGNWIIFWLNRQS